MTTETKTYEERIRRLAKSHGYRLAVTRNNGRPRYKLIGKNERVAFAGNDLEEVTRFMIPMCRTENWQGYPAGTNNA